MARRPVSDNKLLKQLEALYKLSILRPEEENDPGRQNEARTSAFLLLKKARENGVVVKFIVPTQAKNPYDVPDLTRSEEAARRYWRADPFGVSPEYTTADPFGGVADFFTDFLKQQTARMNDEVRRQAAETAQARERVQAREREYAKRTRADHPPSSPFTRPQSPGYKAPRGRNRTTRDTPPLIRNSYETVCRVCNQKIPLGQDVWWIRAVGVAHKECGYTGLVDLVDEPEEG